MTQIPFDFMLPRTTWVCPSSLPDLSHARRIAIDTENFDPHLKSKGPGWLNGTGHCCGISVATDTGFSGYFPIRHEGGGNLDAGLVSAWLKDQCQLGGRDYIFTNAFYDLGWLRTLGVRIGGRVRDISISDTLLDEENVQGYGLEALGRRWLNSGKDETTLKQAANAFGFRPKEDLHRLHARFVGTYAETDAVRTLHIDEKQTPALVAEDLLQALDLETRLTPILFEMSLRGIRVDLDYANRLNERWLREERALLGTLGLTKDDIWNADTVKDLCRKYGIPIPEKDPAVDGSGSLDKDYLTGTGNPDIVPFLKVRAINRSREIYLEQNLIRNSRHGRIHPQFIQMKSDEGGTRTARMASKNPNAQQFPKRSKLFDSKALRKCLIAEDGCQWAKLDFWSQEPIIQTHYALAQKLPGAEEIKKQFAAGIKLATFIEQATSGRCNYDEAKEVALGRSYGMGKAKMSRRMGISQDECADILGAFDEVVPFIKLLADNVSGVAKSRGYIRYFLGYRRRFQYWQPAWRNDGNYYEPRSHAAAVAEWGPQVERAYTYKAFNALCQGSGAIQAKKSLVEIFEAGIMPTLPVHDEINSANITDPKQAQVMKEIMEHAIPLHLPARADLDLGTSWQ